jgi:chromosome segregation ATPase
MTHTGALRLSVRVAVLLAILASVGGTGAAQRVLPTKPGPDDFDAAAEMKMIRAEIREAGRTMVAAQIVVGRLQLLDRRMSYLGAQLADVRRERALNDSRRERPGLALKRAEEGMAAGLTGFDAAMAEARAELARIDESERSLRARESQLTSQMSTLELRWSALEARLEQLERAAGRDRP